MTEQVELELELIRRWRLKALDELAWPIIEPFTEILLHSLWEGILQSSDPLKACSDQRYRFVS
jgi:hypothetical protein